MEEAEVDKHCVSVEEAVTPPAEAVAGVVEGDAEPPDAETVRNAEDVEDAVTVELGVAAIEINVCVGMLDTEELGLPVPELLFEPPSTLVIVLSEVPVVELVEVIDAVALPRSPPEAVTEEDVELVTVTDPVAGLEGLAVAVPLRDASAFVIEPREEPVVEPVGVTVAVSVPWSKPDDAVGVAVTTLRRVPLTLGELEEEEEAEEVEDIEEQGELVEEGEEESRAENEVELVTENETEAVADADSDPVPQGQCDIVLVTDTDAVDDWEIVLSAVGEDVDELLAVIEKTVEGEGEVDAVAHVEPLREALDVNVEVTVAVSEKVEDNAAVLDPIEEAEDVGGGESVREGLFEFDVVADRGGVPEPVLEVVALVLPLRSTGIPLVLTVLVDEAQALPVSER